MLTKPGRTLGLSLAILASVMLFTILPMLQIAMILLVRLRIQSASLPVPGQADSVTPIAVGSSFVGIDDISLIVQTALGIVFLGIAFRGRPAWIRFVMLASVLVLTLVTIALSLAPLITNPDLSRGIDSGEAIRSVFLSGRLLLSVLVAFYVVWYVNRGPARAYYRGYYLSVPSETTTKSKDSA
ncbi:MAG: hypothetical protein ABI835_07580 [Chloroflexota bacterium]